MTLAGQQQNLKVSYDFINFILGNTRVIMGHLYKFTSAAGTADYFTDMDMDVNWGNAIWKSGGLRIEGLKRKLAVGLAVDEQEIKIWALPGDTLWGGAFLSLAEEGGLDGCLITRYRIVWPMTTAVASYNVINATPAAVWVMQTGYMSDITKGGLTHIECKVKSPLVKLDVNMPRNYYQPGCNWTLFDTGCTLSQAAFAVNATLTGTPDRINMLISGGIATPTGADGIANYAQGRIQFTSGVNAGLLTLIGNNDAIALALAYPLDTAPSAGDTVTFWPGCSKAYSTCQLKWSNQNNFRGYDKVPPVMVST